MTWAYFTGRKSNKNAARYLQKMGIYIDAIYKVYKEGHTKSLMGGIYG